MHTIVKTTDAPAAIGPYSQAVRVNNIVFLSGQIPLHPETMTLISGDIKAQTRQVFANIKAVCEASGGSLDRIVKLTIFLTDLDNFADVNAVMEEFISPPYPARSTIQVSALPKAAQIEIEAVMILV